MNIYVGTYAVQSHFSVTNPAIYKLARFLTRKGLLKCNEKLIEQYTQNNWEKNSNCMMSQGDPLTV